MKKLVSTDASSATPTDHMTFDLHIITVLPEFNESMLLLKLYADDPFFNVNLDADQNVAK